MSDLKIELFLMRYRNVREELDMKGPVAKTKHLQPWKDVAYPNSTPKVYKKSWEQAIGDKPWDWNYWILEATLRSYLSGYQRREWLYYEGLNTKRERYLGTLGGLPSTAGWKANAAATGCWEEALTLAQGHGQAAGLAAGLGTRLNAAIDASEAAVAKLTSLRGWLDGTIAELDKRVGGSSGSSNIELDTDSMRSLSGDDLTDGDQSVTPENLKKKWAQTYAELKSLRDRINAVAKDIGAECEAIASVSGDLSQTAKQVDDALKDAKGKKAKQKDFEALGARLQALNDAVGRLGLAAGQLGPNVDKAMALEVEFAQKLKLKNAEGLDPRKVDWDAIAKKTAQGDGTGDADLGDEDQGVYGEKDGKGYKPWKR